MKKLIKTEYHDDKNDGKTYEITHFEEEVAGEVIHSTRITKRPYLDQNVMVADSTKAIIDKIRMKGNE